MSEDELKSYPEHNTEDGGECWCEPEAVEVDGSLIFIHREVH